MKDPAKAEYEAGRVLHQAWYSSGRAIAPPFGLINKWDRLRWIETAKINNAAERKSDLTAGAMPRDDVIRMMREAAPDGIGLDGVWVSTDLPTMERFAALVAAAEREACAKVCEGRIGGAVQTNEWWDGFKTAMKQCAEAIRARGKA